MDLTPEQRDIGKQNFYEAIGTTRRDFLKGTIAGAVAGGSLGAMYFGYGAEVDNPVRIGIIGTGDEGGVLIGALNPNYVDVVAIADIRPYSVYRAFHGDAGNKKARPGLMEVYDWKTEEAARQHVKVYDQKYEEMLDDDDVEAVIIALPLWLHDVAAVKAMRKGKHVLTEKLMGHTVAKCKEMSRVADDTGLLLATGHQRHYSILYDNAVDQIKRGLLGDIHHIRAQWHRGGDSWNPPLPEPKDVSLRDFEVALNASRKAKDKAAEKALLAAHPLYAKLRSWNGRLNNAKKSGDVKEAETWQARVDQLNAQLKDSVVEAASYGYETKTLPTGHQRSALEELIRWRLWNR
ncbi:MAG: Gfo/Idh/MocA family oxidoreductase, partial [Planctomycetota bacterium]